MDRNETFSKLEEALKREEIVLISSYKPVDDKKDLSGSFAKITYLSNPEATLSLSVYGFENGQKMSEKISRVLIQTLGIPRKLEYYYLETAGSLTVNYVS